MAKTYSASEPLPKGTAIVSLLIGDDHALGYGSRAAQVRRWGSEDTTLKSAKTWDKWMGGDRDSVTDNGTGLTPITRGMGHAATDVGLEYPIGVAMEKAWDDAEKPGTPDCVIVKYATPGAVASPTGTVAKSWHPTITGGALDVFLDGYLAPALAHLRANYAEVIADTIYVSLGQADAAIPGAAEALLSNREAIIKEVRAAFSASARVVLIQPPLVDRAAYPTIDVARYAGDVALHSAKESAGIERGGQGAGAAGLNEQFSGQGIVDLGEAIAQVRRDGIGSIR